MSTANLRSAFSKGLKLPLHLRDDLKQLLEPLVQSNELADVIKDVYKVVTVGDLCSLTVYENHGEPDICIVDFKTKRDKIPKLKNRILRIGKKVVRVNNPAGMITKELWDAIQVAYKSNESVRIEVDGEEDLAALVCIAIGPPRTLVLYGVPDRGIGTIHVTKKTKNVVRKILSQMEVM